MSDMTMMTNSHKFQKVYFIVSMCMFFFSGILFLLGTIYAKTVNNAPMVIVTFTSYFFYYHFLHLMIGIASIFYYTSRILKKLLSIRLLKTIIGIILTPISGIICYAALLLLALTNCQA